MSPERGHNRRHVDKTKQKFAVLLISHTLTLARPALDSVRLCCCPVGFLFALEGGG